MAARETLTVPSSPPNGDRFDSRDDVAALSALLDAVCDHAIVRLDRQGLVAAWRGPAQAMFQWPPSEILGHCFSLLLAPDAEPAAAVRLKLADDGDRTEMQDQCRRKDGSRMAASTALVPIRGDGGDVVGYWLVVRDVTAEHASARSIEASSILLQSILATVPDAMIVIDDHAVIVSFSAAAGTLFGYTEAEVVGRNVAMLMPLPDRDRHDSYMAHYLDTGERRIIGKARRVLGLRKDGSTFPQELHVAEAKGGGRRVFAGFIRDLTHREAAAAQLAELQAELLHISRVSAMGTMASTLAHELNQPVTAVANYVETSLALLGSERGERVVVIREALTEAAGEAHRAGKIVRRLREFVARGELDRSSETLTDLIEDACALGLVGAANRGISVERDIDAAVGRVLVDRVQIQQVLINLMRNAVEAVPEGRHGIIRITAQSQRDLVEVTVADNGAGLAPGLATQLFGAFVTTKREGMGLGLSICRTIVEAHGGRIWAEARPVGTAFHFTLPRAPREKHDV